MKKISRLLMLFLCLFALSLPVHAASAATEVQSFVNLSSDGSASVNLNLTLRLEQGGKGITLQLPNNARNATVNGTAYHISESGDIKYISITKATGGMSGVFSMSIHYSLDNVLEFSKANILHANIPILSGFDYPVETTEFTVTFPGEISGIPTFTSLYMQTDVDSIVSYDIDASTLTGSITQELKDHDAFNILIAVEEEQFADAAILKAEGTFVMKAMAVCGALALLYWLAFLRFLPILPQRQTQPPMSITAGDVGSLLAGQGTDLTLMVLSWAQMGYLMIETDARGRILLHKRMEMGNERSDTENRIFAALFRRKDTVLGTGQSYAALCKKVAANRNNVKGYFSQFTGKTAIFAWLCALTGAFAGIDIAKGLTSDGFFQYFWAVVLFLVGLFTARSMQDLSGLWFLHKWDKKLMSLAAIIGWLVLGYLSEQMILAGVVIAISLLAGLLGYYGGLRNTAGRQITAELLGLRRYIHRLHKEKSDIYLNTEYFYRVLPFAMALGVEEQLAKAYERAALPECTFLVYGSRRTPKAREFVKKVREITGTLDERQKTLMLEKILGR